jgi:hypothetical protein
MEPELQAIGHTANFATIAFRILIECLEKKVSCYRSSFRRLSAKQLIIRRQSETVLTIKCSPSF